MSGFIVAAALVLSYFSWQGLREEKGERLAELRRIAASSLDVELRQRERELLDIRDGEWKAAGKTRDELMAFAQGQGAALCIQSPEGRGIYPDAGSVPSPSLEELIARENPDGLPVLRQAQELEFAKGQFGTACSLYAEIEAESASVRAALLHARARAAIRAGRTEEARSAYERLLREFPGRASESGLPYDILARVRLLELHPTVETVQTFIRALSEKGLPGHHRAILLQPLLGLSSEMASLVRQALTAARAMEIIEEALAHGETREDRLLAIEGIPHLLSFRSFGEDAVGLAVPLPARKTALKDSGFAYRTEGLDPAPSSGEILVRRSSPEVPALTMSVSLMDPSRIQLPKGRLYLTGALVLCLMLGLLVGIAAMMRAVAQELKLAQLKGDFVSGVSHELKTPLTSIRMFAEMLEAGQVPNEEKTREYYHLIHRESRRLSRLVENVLDFARIEEGRKVFSFKAHSIMEVVKAAATTFQSLADGQKLDFRLELPPEDLWATLDRDAFMGTLLNLLDNAAKYAGEDGMIKLVLTERDGMAEISVEDNGPGIPSEERERIFERFFRGASAASGPVGGTGLGLTLVKQVVEAHRGSVGVESEPGKGSRFILRIPLCPRSSSSKTIPPSSPGSSMP